MKTELRLHGHINPWIEYFATAAGSRLAHHHFYAIEDQTVRFFSPGNELILTPDQLIQRGTGGALCEYMFGDELPPADLSRSGVVNRLTLLGANINPDGQLTFSDYNQITLDYKEIFLQGHAIHNYFFFIHGLDGDSVRARQGFILRVLGKTIKRLPEPGRCDDSGLVTRILSLLPPECTLYLVRLSHTRNAHFQQESRNLYYPQRNMADIHLKTLDDIGEHLDIDPGQRQRIRLDVIYRHRDNYRVADTYRKLLFSCANQGFVPPAQQQQMSRVKTLALRRQVPDILLSTLDNIYTTNIYLSSPEADYISTSRNLLDQLRAGQQLGNEQVAQFLLCRRLANNHHDYSFDKVFAQYRSELQDDPSFADLYRLFDDMDTTTTAIDRIVFLDNHLPGETIIHHLLSRCMQFNKISAGLFERLFFSGLQKSKYLGNFGRLKLIHLKQGISAVAAGHLKTKELHEELNYITGEEEQYRSTLAAAREWLKANNADIFSNQNQEELYEALNQEIRSANMFSVRLNRQLLQKITHDLQMEHVYLHQLLPDIIANDNQALRADFFSNSGLDFFQIEEIETNYANDNNIAPETLQQLQCHF